MIWNNGDGNDTNDGGDGADETQFNNGTANDVMNVAPVGGGAHQFTPRRRATSTSTSPRARSA